MASIDKRPLKAYVRFDGTGRVVSSSLILRRKMPKVGKWVEIPAYECCNPLPVREIFIEPAGYPMSTPGIAILCNSVQVGYASVNAPVNNIGELVYSLNHHPQYSYYGTYVSAGGGIVKLNMPEALAISLCPSGTITAEIAND